MELTNQEILNLFEVLSRLEVNGNAKFTYTIAKNRALLKPQVDALQSVTQDYAKVNPRVKEYQVKGEELLKKYAVNDDGTPAVRPAQDGQSFQRMIPAKNHAAFVSARAALDEEYKDVTLGFELRQVEFAELLREEMDIPLRTLALKDLPEGALNTSTMNQIFIFVEDPDTVPSVSTEKGEKGEGPRLVK